MMRNCRMMRFVVGIREVRKSCGLRNIKVKKLTGMAKKPEQERKQFSHTGRLRGQRKRKKTEARKTATLDLATTLSIGLLGRNQLVYQIKALQLLCLPQGLSELKF